MDINVVAENLAELLTNSVNMTQVYYDLFFNPEPMDITLYQYDDDNRLVEVVIPNRAKDKIRLEEIAAEVATKISSTEKGQPEGVATLDEGGKVPLSQMQVINDNVVATDTTYSSTKIEAKFAEESNVVHKEGAETITGSKTFTANTYIGTSSTKADLNMHGDLNIQGNIFQSGETYETHAEQVYTKDDYIILRDGATAGLSTGDYAGFQVVKYDGVNNGRLVIDNKGEARVGDEGDEQPLLTRNESENMTANALLRWNATESKAETTTDYYNKQQVDDAVVHKTGNETINGVKTFTSGPIIPIVNINNTGDAAIRRNSVNFVRLTNSGSLVLSGNANTMYLRPNGDANTEGSVSIDTEGNVTATKFIGPLEGTATNAVHDGAGNAIVSTYATKADLGDITTLETTEKDSAVGAINEVFNSVKDDVVHNTGDETVAGVKTFTDTIVGTIENATKATQDASGNVITTTYATQATTGQLSDLDTTDKSNLVSAINEVKGSIPDTSNFVHTTGNETIGGVKTFTSTIVGTINNATNATNATKATQDASGNVITATYATQATTGKLADLITTNKTNLVSAINEVRNAVPDVTNVVHNTGNETVAGVKTFTSDLTTSSTGVNITNTTADVSVKKGGTPFVRLTTNGSLVVSGKANTMYFRPNGDSSSVGAATLDVNGNFTATKFTGPLTGNVTGNVSGSSGSCTGNSATATKATQDASGNVITTTYATKATTGQLTNLATTNKTNLVSAINEVKGAIPGASSLVHTTGNETISGVKTFKSTIVGTINNATNATNATKATQDGNGNNIVNTYATKVALNTKADSSLSNITDAGKQVIKDNSSGWNPPLLASFWSDHLLNRVDMLRADTFSWQNGTTYSSAYNKLVEEYNNSASTTVTEGSITYKLTPSGYKIAASTQENAILTLYNTTGIAWYYILDTTNKRFKLPRMKHKYWKDQSTIPVMGNGTVFGMTMGNNTDIVLTNSANSIMQGLYRGTNIEPRNVQTGNGAGSGTGTFGVTTDPTKSGVVADVSDANIETGFYLYFYVGGFTESAEAQTAGLNSELFNGKADLNFNNMNPSQTAKNIIAGWGLPDYSAGVNYANDTTVHTAPSNGVLVISYYVTALTTGYFKINGENVASSYHNAGYGTMLTGQYMLSEGDTFQITSVASVDSPPFIYRFYPCKGAN